MLLRTAPIRLLLCGSLLLTVAPAFAGSPGKATAKKPAVHKKDAKREIEDLEEQLRLAQLNGDVGVMDKLLSDDYVGISMTGQINTKEQQIDRVRNRSLVITRFDLSDVKIRIVNTIAIVTAFAELDGTNEGLPMKGEYRYTRIYQRLPSGTWKVTNLEATRIPRNRPPGFRPGQESPIPPTQ